MKKSTTFRWIFYAGGLLILAMGIILNTKSGLGVSPIISVAYSISTIWNLNFGNTTFGLYTVFVIIELLLHTCHNYRQRREENHALDASTKKSLPLILGMDLLQLPLSLVFTRFMNLFSSWIPAPEQVGMRFVVLLCGIILTGIGAAMSLNMRIVPNSGDGIVQAIADTIRKPVGFTKNCFDLCNICITITVSLVFAHKLIGVGIGTVVAVLGVGRVIARPFVGTPGNFTRTVRRHDFSLQPPKVTMLDQLCGHGYDVRSVGKIIDIFAEKGIKEYVRTTGNEDGINKTIAYMKQDFEGLCFTNLVDYDMLYGHRNDVEGYAKALTYFDERLPELIDAMRDEDILMITADHGCDPSTPSTDHSREYTPLVMYGKPIRAGVNYGTRGCFSDIAATILAYFDIKPECAGEAIPIL